MKAFWALIALLAIATVVMFAADRGGSGNTTPASQPAAPVIAAPKPTPPAATRSSIETPPIKPEAAAPTQTEQPVLPPAALTVKPDAPGAAPSETPTKPDLTPAEAESPAATPEATTPKVETPNSAPSAATPPPAIENPLPASTEDENLLIKLRQEIEAERAKREAAAKLITTESPSAESPATGTTAPAAQSSGLFGAAAAEAKPDGSILVEGKYIVKGKGTQAEPYKITWDQLISAERDYAPKDGKKSIPDRIQALNDMWVEITGYVAFPLMANETDEMLSMMNQWDGCCIGIPPTPYDAIEVRLSSPVTGDGRLTTYGVIKGKFKVDPHLVGGWLVGLYVVDQGKLTPVAFGGVAP